MSGKLHSSDGWRPTPGFGHAVLWILIVVAAVTPVVAQNLSGTANDDDVFRPFVDRRPITPRSIFAPGVEAYDPGWQLPANASAGREELDLSLDGEPSVPGYDVNDHFVGLVWPFLGISVLKTVATAADADALDVTSTPSGYGDVKVIDRDILIDKRQEVNDRGAGKWWIHHAAIKSSILLDHKLTPEARKPGTVKALIDTLFYTYLNAHWLEIREAVVSELPDKIEYRVRGVSHEGPHSYYRKDGGMGGVDASDYRLDFQFTVTKSDGAIVLRPSIVDNQGVHHEPAAQIDMTSGKPMK